MFCIHVFASSFLIIPKKKLNENNRQKKARNEFIIRLHISIRDFKIQAKTLFFSFKQFGKTYRCHSYFQSQPTKSYLSRFISISHVVSKDLKSILKDILLKVHRHKNLTKRYFMRFIFVLFEFL